jgi:hypothetical protein
MTFYNSRHAYLFAVLLTVLFSCKFEKEGVIDSGNPILINLDSGAKHYSLAEHVDSLRLVGLDTTDNAIISDASNIQRIIHVNGKYILLDGSYMAIKTFDSAGKYLYNIGTLGIRKGQFTRVDDIEWYPNDNSLMVLCNSPTKLAEFSLGGQLMNDTKLNFWATSVAFPSTNSRIYYVNQNKSEASGDKNILFTDSLNQIKARLFEMPKNIKAVVKFSGNLSSNNGEVYFSPAFSNTYYSLSGDTAKSVFKFDYGAKTISADIAQAEWMRNIVKYKFTCQTFVKNEDYLGINYHTNVFGTAFYNLHSGNIITNDPNLDSLNLLFSNFMFQDNDRYIMLMDLSKLSGFIERNNKKIQQKFPMLYARLGQQRSNKHLGLLVFKLKPV